MKATSRKNRGSSIFFAIMLTILLAVTGCGNSDDGDGTIVVRLGVTTDETRIWRAVQRQLDEWGYNIHINQINLAGNRPNLVLAEREIDISMFQHYAFFWRETEELGLPLVAIGETLIMPLNMFSERWDSPDEIPNGGQIAVPEDSTNQGRALNVLQNAGLIELDPTAGNNAMVRDITSNPLNLRFVEMEAAQIPRALPDVDAGVVNTNWIVDLGWDPINDAIFVDQIDLQDPRYQPFINIFAVHEDDEHSETFAKIVRAYRTQGVADAIREVFGGAVIPAFPHVWD